MKNNLSQFNILFKYFLIFTFFVSPLLNANKISKDSLEIKDHADIVFDSLVFKLRNEAVDTIKINLLNEISWNYSPTNFIKSKQYADSALNLARKIKWQKGEAHALENIGEALRYNGRVEESLKKFQTSLLIFQQLNNQKEIAKVYNHIGISYHYLSDLQKAYENFNNALNIYGKINDKEGLVKGNTYLGVLFYQFNDYQKSLVYYNKALKMAEGLNMESTYASIMVNIGIVYGELENYSESLRYNQIAGNIFKKLNDIHNYSIQLGNIGGLYLKQKIYDKALVYSEKALYYREIMEDRNGIAQQNALLGEIKYNMAINTSIPVSKKEKEKLLLSSINNLNKSSVLYGELGNKIEQHEDLLLISKVYKISGKYLQALNALEKAQTIENSLRISKVNETIAVLEAKQYLNLKEKEIEILNKDNAYQKLLKKVLIGIALILVLLTAFIYYLYNNNRKHNRILEENIQIREAVEESLRKNEIELNKHKTQLEVIVKKRTSELENEILERKRTEEDLLVAIERVEAANKAKSIFLANMSHELRTPLVGILGYSQLLSSEAEKKELKEMAEGIYRTGNRLLNTLSMVLDLARIESDQFEINITKVDVVEELTDIYNNFKGAVSVKNIDFVLKLSEDAKELYTDAGMFKVIVENLVNNAIKFTKEGKITVESSIEKNSTKEYFVLNVIDTGIGIKRNELSIIFNEFKQLSEGTLKDFQGTGLGLSISKKFIEHLNGELTVESKFGEGSKFTTKFPIS